MDSKTTNTTKTAVAGGKTEADLSHESVSSLFKTWQDEGVPDDCGAMDDFAYTPTVSRSTMRDVFESPDVKSSTILELPPLHDHKSLRKTTPTASTDKRRKRPLCTFLNHMGTRTGTMSAASSSNTSVASESDLVSEVSSLPSLAEEEDHHLFHAMLTGSGGHPAHAHHYHRHSDFGAKRFSFAPDMSIVTVVNEGKKQSHLSSTTTSTTTTTTTTLSGAASKPAAKRRKLTMPPLRADIKVPKINAKLKNDPKMMEYKAKLDKLVGELQKTRRQLRKICRESANDSSSSS